MGKKKGPTTTDALGNTVLVADLEAQKALEEERRIARERREAKAAAAAAEKADGGDGGAAAAAAAAAAGGSEGAAAGDGPPGIVSLEDTLRQLMVRPKAAGSFRECWPRPRRRGGSRRPSLRTRAARRRRRAAAAFSLPESWARALDAVSVHVRGGGGAEEDEEGPRGRSRATTGAVVDAAGMDVSVRGVKLLEDAELRMLAGRRYALLGANGSGKSTVVRLIASGRLRANVHDVACVAQELDGSSEESAFGALVASDHTTARLLAEEAGLCLEMEAAEVASAAGGAGEEEEERPMKAKSSSGSEPWDETRWAAAAERLGELSGQLEARDAYAAEGSARRILTGLGFSSEMQDAPLSTLSGGWRMRAALAQALFLEPGLLLLDEPTNHLDLPATIWLASYLTSPAAAKTCVLLVTHSADFVASAATDLLYLDHFAKTLTRHGGDVWSFLNGAEGRYKKQLKEFEAQQKALRDIKSRGATGEKALQKLLKVPGQPGVLLDKPREYSVKFRFPSASDDRPTIAVLDAGYTVPGWKEPLYSDLRFSVHSQSRIALVGPNGCGKSTLLGLLNGRLEPTSGEVSRDRRLVVGRYDQHFDDLLPVGDDQPKTSGAAFLCQRFGVAEQEARKLLGQSGLEGNAHLTPIRSLSGGQKSRVLFAALAKTEAHVLILDEPTNHLDLESVEALIEGLNQFQGGIVVSTHDARLVEGLEDCEVWVCGTEAGTKKAGKQGGEAGAGSGVRRLPAGGFARYRDAVAQEVEERVRRANAEAARRKKGLKERAAGRAGGGKKSS